MTLIKAMRRRNEALHSVKAPNHSRSQSSQEPVLEDNDDVFAKLEKRYLSDSASSSTDTDDESQIVTPPYYHRAMTDPLAERKHFFNDEAFPTLPRYPDSESNCWSEPCHEIYSVRGENYLQDSQKVQSGPYLLRARGCDLLLSPQGCAPPKNVGRYVVVGIYAKVILSSSIVELSFSALCLLFFSLSLTVPIIDTPSALLSLSSYSPNRFSFTLSIAIHKYSEVHCDRSLHLFLNFDCLGVCYPCTLKSLSIYVSTFVPILLPLMKRYHHRNEHWLSFSRAMNLTRILHSNSFHLFPKDLGLHATWFLENLPLLETNFQ